MKIRSIGSIQIPIIIFIPIIIRGLTAPFFKSAALSIGEFTFSNIIVNYLFWISMFLFFLRALSWQIVLKKYPLSYVYPFTSISLIIILFISKFYFKEPLGIFNVLGSILIIIGIIVFASGKSE